MRRVATEAPIRLTCLALHVIREQTECTAETRRGNAPLYARSQLVWIERLCVSRTSLRQRFVAKTRKRIGASPKGFVPAPL